MGLAASQGTLLSLTARRIDLEFQGQAINQQRLEIAAQEEQLAKTYSDALSSTQLRVSVSDNSGNTSLTLLSADSLAQNNTVIIDTSKTPPEPISHGLNATEIENGLRDGKFETCEMTTEDGHAIGNYDNSGNWSYNGSYNVTDLQNRAFVWNGLMPSGSPSPIQTTTDSDAQSHAEQVYQAALAEIEPTDKMLEVHLKDIDTQHQAIQTEIDAVKKVIDKDIESSFKTFAQA